eukprot:4912594-Heterocapsa_arctica.AAC.1
MLEIWVAQHPVQIQSTKGNTGPAAHRQHRAVHGTHHEGLPPRSRPSRSRLLNLPRYDVVDL